MATPAHPVPTPAEDDVPSLDATLRTLVRLDEYHTLGCIAWCDPDLVLPPASRHVALQSLERDLADGLLSDRVVRDPHPAEHANFVTGAFATTPGRVLVRLLGAVTDDALAQLRTHGATPCYRWTDALEAEVRRLALRIVAPVTEVARWVNGNALTTVVDQDWVKGALAVALWERATADERSAVLGLVALLAEATGLSIVPGPHPDTILQDYVRRCEAQGRTAPLDWLAIYDELGGDPWETWDGDAEDARESVVLARALAHHLGLDAWAPHIAPLAAEDLELLLQHPDARVRVTTATHGIAAAPLLHSLPAPAHNPGSTPARRRTR